MNNKENGSALVAVLGNLGLASLCIGGGMGTAVIIKKA